LTHPLGPSPPLFQFPHFACCSRCCSLRCISINHFDCLRNRDRRHPLKRYPPPFTYYCSNTLPTSRVHGPRPCTRHVHGRQHGPTRPVRGRVHGPFTAVYTAVYTGIRVHRRYKAVYAPYTRPCTRPVHSHIHGPCTRPVHGSVVFVYTGRVHGRVHGPSCTWQVGLPGHVHVPGRLRPVTTVYTARSQPIHGSVYGHTQPCTCSSTRAVYTVAYTDRMPYGRSVPSGNVYTAR